VATSPTRFSPIGLRLETRANLFNLAPYREGWIEVQDESSQLAALLVDAKPGMRALDLCAGAGGKTLALAAAMGNRGSIVACDVLERRLARMAPRLARAGARIVKTVRLDANGKAYDRLGAFDRVLIDAPCTGTGTWRRRPETKWRLTRNWRINIQGAQRMLLDDGGAPFVRPNGRLIFATCSILPAEGREILDAFLAEHKGWRAIPADRVWREVLGTKAPFDGPYMLLTPHRHGTDGFFAAILAPP
jgi:16S rRNA (cytosine967-C5)-methyltransferase